MKKHLLLFLLTLQSVVLNAGIYEKINGIYYYLDSYTPRYSSVHYRATVNALPSGNYSGNVNIPSEVKYDEITYKVESIGERAFQNCTALTSVTIPETVTSIGSSAFYNCSELTSINIPNSVTSIGKSAFSACSGLTSVTIPSSVKTIGENLFYYCSSLTSIVIPESVTYINPSAFEYCSALTSIIVAPGNTKYDSRDNCNAIIETSTKTLVLGCSTTVFPNSVKRIGENAFYGCSGLTSVVIPNGVTSIGKSAFNCCSGLTSITIPESVTSIGDYAFSGCSGLTKAEFASIESLCNISFGNSYSNPLGCTHHLYIDGQEVKDVIIPNSVTSIGGSAFFGCSGLTSITIPNSVTSIGGSAFYECSGLMSITIPNSVTSSIGDWAFCGCTSLTSVTIGSGVTSIGKFAFDGCSRLMSIIIPESVTSIGYQAFFQCTGLKSAIIGNGVRSIGESAFQECSNLTSVTIGNSVTDIGYYAFLGCSCLTSVTIPQSVTRIGDSAFSTCSVTSIMVEAGNAVYDSRNNCNAIIRTASNTLETGCINTVIPKSVTSIGDDAFWGSGLTAITIPNSVTRIGARAFGHCSDLTSVTIGSGVTSIGWYAFSGCSSLMSVTCLAESVPTAGRYVFDDVPTESATLYVPKSSVNAYKTAEEWRRFRNIVEIDPTGVEELKAQNTSDAKADKNAPVYDLMGRRLKEKPAKGYYIQGGKKYFVK